MERALRRPIYALAPRIFALGPFKETMARRSLKTHAEDLDRRYWAPYREALKAEFDQDEILIRATAIERL